MASVSLLAFDAASGASASEACMFCQSMSPAAEHASTQLVSTSLGVFFLSGSSTEADIPLQIMAQADTLLNARDLDRVDSSKDLTLCSEDPRSSFGRRLPSC